MIPWSRSIRQKYGCNTAFLQLHNSVDSVGVSADTVMHNPPKVADNQLKLTVELRQAPESADGRVQVNAAIPRGIIIVANRLVSAHRYSFAVHGGLGLSNSNRLQIRIHFVGNDRFAEQIALCKFNLIVQRFDNHFFGFYLAGDQLHAPACKV